MSRALDALLRLRRSQRDRRDLERACAERALRAARGEHAQSLAREAEGAAALLRAGREGRPGAWWPGAAQGIAMLVRLARSRAECVGEAESARDAAERERVAAERALMLLLRLNERVERERRRSRERAEQRRLDEIGTRRVLAALLALLAFGGASPSSASAGGPAGGDPALAPVLAELRTKQTQLERRERELDDRERHVTELEAAASAQLDEASALAAQVEERMNAWQQTQGDKAIARLARIYGSMAPQAAAPLLEALELELATRIVAKMKPEKSSALLPFVSEERALAMSRLVARPLAANPPPAEAAR